MIEFLKGFLIYMIIWWIVVFTILPIGIKRADKVEKGHAEGAPQNPLILKSGKNLKKKEAEFTQ